MGWPDLENMMSDALDGTFAESFEFRPMTRPSVNEALTDDGTRTVRTVEAIFTEETELAPELGRERSSGFRHRGSAAATMPDPFLDVDEREFEGDDVRAGDHFLRAATGKLYRAASVKPNGQGRMQIELHHEGTE